MKKRRVIDEGPDPIDRHVGARVRTRRVGLGVSQTRLGQALGVTFQQIQKYENGSNRIGASNLHRIAETLDVGVGYFFEGIEPAGAHGPGLSDHGAEFQGDPLASREAIELMHNYYRITDPTVRRRLFQFVRSVAKLEGGPHPEDDPSPED